MQKNDKKQRLAKAYVSCKEYMELHNCSDHARTRIDDIMLASIRTLGFLWDSNADQALDYVLNAIIMQMSEIVAIETNESPREVYLRIIRQKH